MAGCAWSPPTATASPTPPRPRRAGDATAATEAILPRKTVLELARQLADSDDRSRSCCRQPGRLPLSVELVSKLIDGKFPDYERVIPTAHPKLIKAARQPLLPPCSVPPSSPTRSSAACAGARRTACCASCRQRRAGRGHGRARGSTTRATGLDIGFNVTYLLDVLNNPSSEIRSTGASTTATPAP